MAQIPLFVPLESNPDLFTKIIHDIGVLPCLEFRDVYSINEPSLLALLPRPVLALILVGPTEMAQEDKQATTEYAKTGDEEDIIWFKQTIRNACGLYAILHSVANGVSSDFIKPDSIIDKLLATCRPLPPDERAKAIEACEGLEKAYKSAARLHDQSSVPGELEDLGNHYLCFAKSQKDGHLYQISSSRLSGPVDKGLVGEHDDVLGPEGTAVIQKFLDSGQSCPKAVFSLIALVPTSDL
ncbi:hypothetical protein AK830_g5412 [Neonectria ditissima]|uniref:Ubiquitin carboxyl-terminal hydrolase n=1 Tax=Neonectria ditissima TaxID=78410 RepID=A0A0P7B4Y8_9HYPO|nr:hypothetical protein AK830_g5412 [Neonectria ditissima]